MIFFKIGEQWPDNSQEWKWTVNSDVDHDCKQAWKTWDSKYFLCMKSKVEKTKTVTFQRQPGSKTDWTWPFFNQEETLNQDESYRVPCIGDSGSGQFIEIEYTTTKPTPKKQSKFVLAAVLKGGISHQFSTKYKDKNGQIKTRRHDVPCGSYTYNQKQKIYNQDTSFSQSTTFPDIFKWIKCQIIDIDSI